MGKVKKILVICTGNACRSPMAEGFLKKYLKPEGGFEISSAGVAAVAGAHASPFAVEVMKQEGIDISSHSTRPFSSDTAKAADVILAMTNAHKDFVISAVPEIKDKVFLYKEFAGTDDKDTEIADPIGRPIPVYRELCNTIKDLTQNIAIKIKESTGRDNADEDSDRFGPRGV